MVTPQERLDHNLYHRCYNFFRDKTPYPKVDNTTDPDLKSGWDGSPEYGIMASFIKLPFGDLWDNIISFQGNGFCGDLEYYMMNCLEAYGLPKSYVKCRDYVEDFFECSRHYTQMDRCRAMRNERRRQFNAGERDIKYAVPPKLWSFQD